PREADRAQDARDDLWRRPAGDQGMGVAGAVARPPHSVNGEPGGRTRRARLIRADPAQDEGLDRLGLALNVELRHALDLDPVRERVVGPDADHDAPGDGLALEPGREVDGVADDAVPAVAALASD